MTICIGALCNSGEIAIAAGDRMITASYPPVQFEPETNKIIKLTNNCVVLCAGDALAHVEILREAKIKIHGSADPSVNKIIESIKNRFIEKKKQIANESLLLPRGLSIDSLYGDKAKTLPTEFIAHMDIIVASINLGINMLICAVDDEGAHLYTIKEGSPIESLSRCFDSLGYSAIGSGQIHAMSTFIYSGYVTKFPLENALYVVYEAKKVSENAPGVGKATDISIISRQGIQYLDDNDIKRLDEIYNKKAKKIEEPENQKELAHFKKFLPKKENEK